MKAAWQTQEIPWKPGGIYLFVRNPPKTLQKVTNDPKICE
jgi:hypothetical protein